jgi:hypothetical protein
VGSISSPKRAAALRRLPSRHRHIGTAQGYVDVNTEQLRAALDQLWALTAQFYVTVGSVKNFLTKQAFYPKPRSYNFLFELDADTKKELIGQIGEPVYSAATATASGTGNTGRT